MKLRTEIPLKKQEKNQLDYNSNVLLIGSCFSANIGKKLQYFKLDTIINPFGILFHPKAIKQFIEHTIHQKKFTEADIIYHNEYWHCFDAHSSLSSPDKHKLLDTLNNTIASTYKRLKESTHIIITLGTSWVYKHLESDKIVANCHKIPQKHFSKEILEIHEITQTLEQINNLIHSVNNQTEIIYTVSPVKHIKDGFIENQQSKSHLITSIHQIKNTKKTSYFPSYEIMIDELRDYRFYKEDMIHPNNTAIDYIWSKFKKVWLADSTEKIMSKIDIIQKGLAHRTINPNSEAHQKFIANLENKIEELNKEHPTIQFNH